MGGIYTQPLMERIMKKGVGFLQGGGDLAFMTAAARERVAFLGGIKLVK